MNRLVGSLLLVSVACIGQTMDGHPIGSQASSPHPSSQSYNEYIHQQQQGTPSRVGSQANSSSQNSTVASQSHQLARQKEIQQQTQELVLQTQAANSPAARKSKAPLHESIFVESKKYVNYNAVIAIVLGFFVIVLLISLLVGVVAWAAGQVVKLSLLETQRKDQIHQRFADEPAAAIGEMIQEQV